MGIIPGFKHDLFVSYAHLDNATASHGSKGWVDVLIEQVRVEVFKRLGTNKFDCWTDHELEGNRPFTPAILDAINSTALLLVVVSPGYLNSEWCRRERNDFLAVARDRVAESSIFIVHAREVDRREMPPEFGDLLGYTFWTRDEETRADRPLGFPDPLEMKFVSRVYELSQDIKKQVHALVQAAPTSTRPAPSTPPPAAGVFVARSTEDLEDQADDVRSYLSQAKLNVFPRTWYPTNDEAAYKSAMLEELRQCKTYAQLISAARGERICPNAEARLPQLQYEIARAAGIPMVLWRERGVDVAAVRDAAHKALLEQARACGIEEFKRAIVDEARRKAPAEARPTSSVVVFVDADSPDRALAREVGTTLGKFGVDCYWPLDGGAAEAIRVDLEDNIRSCDGLLLVYGSTGAVWVRSQLRQVRKLISQREKPLSALAVFEGPPTPKAALDAAIPNLLTLDCRRGIDVSILEQFVRTLHD